MTTPPGWSSPPPPPPPPESAQPPPASPDLRPLNVGDVLDGMFRLFIRHWQVYTAAIAAIVVPTQLLLAFLQRDLVSDIGLIDLFTDPTAANVAAGSAPEFGDFGSTVVFGILSTIFITPLITGIAVHIGARAHMGQPVEAGASLRAGFRRYLPLVGVNVLSWLAILLAGGLAVVPLLGMAFADISAIGIVLLGFPLGLLALALVMAVYTLLLVAPVVVMLEERGAFGAIGRSVQLARRRFWGVLGIGLLAWIISTIIGSVLSWPFGLPAALFGGTVGLVLTTVGSLVVGIVAAPLMPNAVALLYTDLRVRGEGLDLEAMVRGVEGGNPA